MSFIGKLLGFIIGFRFGGFFGGVFGVILGHMVDKKIYNLGSVKSSIFGKSMTRQELFLQTSFAVMGHLSKAKGRVTQEDIELAKNYMSQLQLDEHSRKIAQKAFSLGKEADFPIRQVIREFRSACDRRRDLLRMFLDIQIQTAFADGELHSNEKALLFVIADELGISHAQFESMLAMILASQQFASGGYQQGYGYQQGGYQQGGYQQGGYQQGGYQQAQGYQSEAQIDAAYQTLGVNKGDDKLSVKRAYRRLMNEYHPDKLVAKGLPPEMMKMAKEKAQRIQAAYDLICKSKEWKS